MDPAASVALLYDDSAYVETVHRPREFAADAPAGLVGRQVAGREFLDAFLTHGTGDELTALVYNQASADSLVRFCEQHPSSRERRRRLQVVRMDAFLDAFFPRSPAPVLYTPCPPDPAFAWARRQHGPAAFALSGVTHTLCTVGAVRVLCEMVTGPYEPFDALICTSTSVVRMVRSLTGTYADYLRDRFGGAPSFRPRLETIPLGVNPDRFRPAMPKDRAERRAALNIADDEVAVLFVGRFTPHAKAHPFPLFHGVAEAARQTGRMVHLVLSGWAPSQPMLQAYLDGLRAFAPGVPVSVVDGMDPDLRFGVWHSADVFTSLSDSIQETFGLVVIEAMASGLPVVAADWNGYRDLVADGETGFLVPTYMLREATADATLRLLLQGSNYDAFLAECNQTVAVDPAAAVQAYARLLSDPPLRQRMGDAGRQRVLERFTWQRVVRAYEELWREQDKERRARSNPSPQPPPRSGEGEQEARRASEGMENVIPAPPLRFGEGVGGRGCFSTTGPACYPAPEETFAGYPTRLLAEDDLVETVPGSDHQLGLALSLPLIAYAGERRSSEENVLRALLVEAIQPRTIARLDAILERLGVEHQKGRATLAWMLKYGLLRISP
jgi:glycosyltransferase involved in cell wall biosynthesis